MRQLLQFPGPTNLRLPYKSHDSKKLDDAAERALDHHFPPAEPKPPKRIDQLFSVGPGSRSSKALALSRMADGVHLLVERALDHLDDPEIAAILARKQSRAC